MSKSHTAWRRLAIATFAASLCAAPAPAPAACAGDCDGDAQVAIAELIAAVGIALGARPLAACPAADADADGAVAIADLVAAVAAALAGCPPAATATATPDGATATATPDGEQIPPTRGGALRDWLAAGSYLGWAAESSAHASAGPHFGAVRVFVNDALLDSLSRGVAHPAGAAAVKELYGGGSEIMGWSVMVKIEGDSDGGEGWYWFERFNSTTFANGRGVTLCSNCHAGGRDYILIPFPLQ